MSKLNPENIVAIGVIASHIRLARLIYSAASHSLNRSFQVGLKCPMLEFQYALLWMPVVERFLLVLQHGNLGCTIELLTSATHLRCRTDTCVPQSIFLSRFVQ
jgi:hypothetical protein